MTKEQAAWQHRSDLVDAEYSSRMGQIYGPPITRNKRQKRTREIVEAFIFIACVLIYLWL